MQVAVDHRGREQLEGLRALHLFPGAACSLLARVPGLSKPILHKSPFLAEVAPQPPVRWAPILLAVINPTSLCAAQRPQTTFSSKFCSSVHGNELRVKVFRGERPVFFPFTVFKKLTYPSRAYLFWARMHQLCFLQSTSHPSSLRVRWP